MKGREMTEEWLTIQLFLADDGVYEVEANSDDHRDIRCSCSAFMSRKKCTHTKYIEKKIKENEGRYSIHLPVDITDEELEEAMTDPAAFRDLIIHHSKIEVIQ